MPIYEYKCENGHVFDVIQKMTDEPLTECEECGAPAARVLSAAGDPLQGLGLPQHRLRDEAGRRQRRLRGRRREELATRARRESKSDSGKSESKSDSKPAASTAD